MLSIITAVKVQNKWSLRGYQLTGSSSSTQLTAEYWVMPAGEAASASPHILQSHSRLALSSISSFMMRTTDTEFNINEVLGLQESSSNVLFFCDVSDLEISPPPFSFCHSSPSKEIISAENILRTPVCQSLSHEYEAMLIKANA